MVHCGYEGDGGHRYRSSNPLKAAQGQSSAAIKTEGPLAPEIDLWRSQRPADFVFDNPVVDDAVSKDMHDAADDANSRRYFPGLPQLANSRQSEDLQRGAARLPGPTTSHA